MPAFKEKYRKIEGCGKKAVKRRKATTKGVV